MLNTTKHSTFGDCAKLFCLLHTENDQSPDSNKHNNYFEECVTNPPTYVNNSYHPLYAIIGKRATPLDLNVINVLHRGQLILSAADHCFFPSGFPLYSDFIINNKS